MSTKKLLLKDLQPDMQNANKHTQHGMGLLEKSLEENGVGRSILISNDNVVIAGNGTLEIAAQLGLENVQVVESDGTKIIAVKRTDIESGSDEFYQMALADNIVSKKNIVMDVETIEAIAQDYKVEDWKAEALTIGGSKGNYQKNPDTVLRYVVEITVKNEAEQTKLFNKLNAQGYDCRVATLNK